MDTNQLLTNSESYALRPDVAVTIVGDGAVMLDLSTKFFYSLNQTGWALAQLFEDGATPAQVAEAAVTLGALAEDGDAIARFIGSLLSANLLEAGEAADVPQLPAYNGGWIEPTLEKHPEPLQRIMTSAFDPSIPLAE